MSDGHYLEWWIIWYYNMWLIRSNYSVFSHKEPHEMTFQNWICFWQHLSHYSSKIFDIHKVYTWNTAVSCELFQTCGRYSQQDLYQTSVPRMSSSFHYFRFPFALRQLSTCLTFANWSTRIIKFQWVEWGYLPSKYRVNIQFVASKNHGIAKKIDYICKGTFQSQGKTFLVNIWIYLNIWTFTWIIYFCKGLIHGYLFRRCWKFYRQMFDWTTSLRKKFHIFNSVFMQQRA